MSKVEFIFLAVKSVNEEHYNREEFQPMNILFEALEYVKGNDNYEIKVKAKYGITFDRNKSHLPYHFETKLIPTEIRNKAETEILKDLDTEYQNWFNQALHKN